MSGKRTDQVSPFGIPSFPETKDHRLPESVVGRTDEREHRQDGSNPCEEATVEATFLVSWLASGEWW